MAYLVVAALVFGACYFVDCFFTKTFRAKSQHKSGLSVKHNKRTALFGIFLTVLAVLGILMGISKGTALLLGGLLVLLMGIGLILYYLTFGIYYDDRSFLLSTFRQKDREYTFGQIRAQKLYLLQGGNIIVELHMDDGTAVSLQSTMDGVYPFLDHAFHSWCAQTGRNPETCEFYDPAGSRWFPDVEVA